MPADTLSSSPANARHNSDGARDVSAAAAHALVCDFVTGQAASSETAASSGWASYRAVFLSAEVQDLIFARLGGDGQDDAEDTSADSGGQGGPKKKQNKKRKLDAGPAPAADVSWTVCCLDGATFSVAVPEQARVAEIKGAIATLREVPCFTMELFVQDVEEPLDDERRVGLADRVPLFLLTKCPSDRLALEAFFKSTGGANWTNKTGWMTDAELGDWHGVTVDEEGRVTRLDLRDNGLAGPLPSDIQQLSALQVLDLYGNKLTGPIPAELGQLGALQNLILGSNQLTGPIPAELGQLGALQNLILDNNQLTGPIPAELGQLGALQNLLLDSNQLTGPIPRELAQLGALELLGLHRNQLSGPIPPELGQLGGLQYLLLSHTQLSGPIPPELGQLGALQHLELSHTQLSGPIPAELGQMGALTHLGLNSNPQLTGQEAFQGHMLAHHPDCELSL
jgi:hypothetical protein